MIDNKNIGQTLKSERKAAGKSLADVARKCGTDPSTISRRESRTKSGFFKSWLQHFLELGIDPIEFYGLKKKEPVKNLTPLERANLNKEMEKQRKRESNPKVQEW